MSVSKEKLEEHNAKTNPDEVLGIFNMIPLVEKLSGPRAHMVSNFMEQMIMLNNPEIPRVFTGREKEFASFNDSLIKANTNFHVLHKIDKFPNLPGSHYTLVLQDVATGVVDVVEVKHYENLTEDHGYVKPMTPIDNVVAGGLIHKNDIIAKSNSHDDLMNYRYGINANTAYISNRSVIQDGIVISESFSKRVSYYHVETIKVNLKFKDILLNYYGNENSYQAFPEIGQPTKDGIFAVQRTLDDASIRRMATVKMLSTICTDDEKISGSGILLDVNIYCNSFSKLRKDMAHHEQISRYLEIISSYKKRVADAIDACVHNKMKVTEKAQDILNKHKDYLYAQADRDERVVFYNEGGMFEFCYMEFVVAKEMFIGNGSKLTNRFGGKGVVCEVVPDELMPIDQFGRRVEVILNPCGVIKRSNPGQLFELELNFIATRVVDQVKKMGDIHKKYNHLHKFFSMVNTMYGEWFERTCAMMGPDWMNAAIKDIEKNGICLRVPPFRDPKTDTVDGDVHLNVTFESLKQLYKTFNVKPQRVKVKKRTPWGIKEYESKNAVIVAPSYMMVLKHTTDNKFSVVSIGDTDTKGLPLKVSGKKTSAVRKTPIKFGTMETGLGILKAGPEMIKRFLAASGLNIKHREDVASMLLTSNPFETHNIPVSNVKNNIGSNVLIALLRQMGYCVYSKKIRHEIEIGVSDK